MNLAKLKGWLDGILSSFLVILFTVAVVNVLWQVMTRFLLNNPSSWTEELARFLLIWVSLFGAAYAVGEKKHLAMEFLYMKLSRHGQFLLDIVIEVVLILFSFFVMILGGAKLVLLILKLGQTSPALQIPVAWVYMALPLSGLCILIYSVIHLLSLRKKNGEVRDAD